MKTFNEPDMENGAKDPWSENERVEYLIKTYGQYGLRLEGKFFVIETDKGIEYFHDWKKFPIGSMGVENHIREYLGLERLEKAVEGREDKAA